MGFQVLSVLTGGEDVLTCGFNSENLPLPLDFTPAAANSQIFATYPPALVTVIQTGLLIDFTAVLHANSLQRT
jgi:hypothetical protein